jgi:hypothetical protein
VESREPTEAKTPQKVGLAVTIEYPPSVRGDSEVVRRLDVATITFNVADLPRNLNEKLIAGMESLKQAGASIAAVVTLLIRKGIISATEFDENCDAMEEEIMKRAFENVADRAALEKKTEEP